jgi:hypothetical protein
MNWRRKLRDRHAAETPAESYSLATFGDPDLGRDAGDDLMKRLGSYLKGYTLGTLFVLVHVATQGPRLRADNR